MVTTIEDGGLPKSLLHALALAHLGRHNEVPVLHADRVTLPACREPRNRETPA